MLSTSAFNALLKTLEEPPAHVVFIFATTDPHKIPDTILSRCQSYEFKLIPLQLLLETLKSICDREQIVIDQELLMLIARKAEGSLRDGLSFLDQAISFGVEQLTRRELVELLGVVDREFLLELVQALLEGDTEKVLERFEATAEFRFEPRQFYQDLIELLRDLVVVKLSKNPARLVVAPDSELKRLIALAAAHSPDTLQRQFDLLSAAENDVLRSGHPRLMLEMTLLKLAHTRPVLELDGLIDRLDRLIDGRAIAAPARRTPPSPAPSPARPAEPEPAAAAEPCAEPEPAAAGDRPPQWAKLIETAKAKKLSAGTLLANGVPEQLGPDLVRIRLNPAHLNLLGRAEDNEAVLDAVAAVFGEEARLELLPLENGGTHPAASAKKKETDKLRALKRMALEAPAVKEALEVFDGDVVDVQIEPQRR